MITAPTDERAPEASGRPAASSAPRRPRPPLVPILVATVFFIGVLVVLYPTIASWFAQYEQSQRIGQYSAEVTDLGATARDDAIRAASAYNDTLTGIASVAANQRIPQGDGGGDIDAYGGLLAADSQGLMARIKIPAINLDLPIYHGTSDEVLRRGIGHLEGTALPVGGTNTHSVLTGHRGLASAELFTKLDRVKIGDTFTIEVFGEVLTYRVFSTEVVAPEETETLYPRQGEDLITLVTCTPLGVNSHRILVTGERILPTPVRDLQAAAAPPDVPGFPWWALGLAGTAVVLAVYVSATRSLPRRRP